mmetsp:Transcript_5754/g.8827  ORF Transcript_5754/g.8827 Transcript_5754/m.8827 type:complete len:122 (+) Transcript_5754:68-433(+)
MRGCESRIKNSGRATFRVFQSQGMPRSEQQQQKTAIPLYKTHKLLFGFYSIEPSCILFFSSTFWLLHARSRICLVPSTASKEHCPKSKCPLCTHSRMKHTRDHFHYNVKISIEMHDAIDAL